MKLIVGLGNVGSTYEGTRHNIGFMSIDRFADKYNVEFRENKSFKGYVGEARIGGEKVLLLKPTTFMNLSGDSVILVKKFYKIDTKDIIVINDDLDMPVGKVRYRAKGSAGGHNGLKSIILNLGTEEFQRIKVGIDRSKVIPVVDWVLGRFSKDDLDILNKNVFDKIILGLEAFIEGVGENKLANTINA
ncbi:MAG: aminoacyl-tRNA hydrolase [Acholeplasmatales bacterium]|nr:aminoacyl-tRNA hydrolase [Acholeplasmatales bacterium]